MGQQEEAEVATAAVVRHPLQTEVVARSSPRMLKGRYDEGVEVRRLEPPQVLVVDDEPANVRLVQAYLKAEGFRVLGANGGAEALERKESRGGHFREDFPDKDPALGGINILVRKGKGGEMLVSRQPVPEMPAALKKVIEDMK